MNSKNHKSQSAYAASSSSNANGSSTSSSSTPSSSSVLSPKCQKCVDMLQKAILKSADDSSNPSLPLQLLRAMGASSSTKESIQLESNGVTIRLPKEQPRQVKIQKQWSEQQSVPPHHASVQHRHHSPIRTTTTTTTINATSATSITSSSASSLGAMQNNNNDTILQQQQQHDSMKIECRPCGEVGPEGGARAFVTGPEPISIVLCTNRLQSLEEIQQVLVHELIHVYDVRQLKLDLTSCQELAYSEIRAAKHAECASTAPTDNNPNNLSSLLKLPTTLFQTSCIKSKATAATSNLFTKPGQAKDCINRVFTKAMNDTRPFSSFSSGTTTTQGRRNNYTTPKKPYDSGAWHSQR